MQGICGETTAKKYKISREEQDEYAIRSYKLTRQSAEAGLFKSEIVPVLIPQKKGMFITF
jgi:acetyl-CoA C-acetyltransferase